MRCSVLLLLLGAHAATDRTVLRGRPHGTLVDAVPPPSGAIPHNVTADCALCAETPLQASHSAVMETGVVMAAGSVMLLFCFFAMRCRQLDEQGRVAEPRAGGRDARLVQDLADGERRACTSCRCRFVLTAATLKEVKCPMCRPHARRSPPTGADTRASGEAARTPRGGESGAAEMDAPAAALPAAVELARLGTATLSQAPLPNRLVAAALPLAHGEGSAELDGSDRLS